MVETVIMRFSMDKIKSIGTDVLVNPKPNHLILKSSVSLYDFCTNKKFNITYKYIIVIISGIRNLTQLNNTTSNTSSNSANVKPSNRWIKLLIKYNSPIRPIIAVNEKKKRIVKALLLIFIPKKLSSFLSLLLIKTLSFKLIS